SPSDDGRSRRGADLDRPHAMRRLRAFRLHLRHLRAVLPSVRGDDLGLDSDLLLRLADAQPRPLRRAVQGALRARSLTRRLGTTPAIPGFRSLQSRLRPALFRLRGPDASTRARNHHRARGLCGADRRCRRRVLKDADRLPPRAAPGLPQQRRSASGRFGLGPDREGRPARHRHHSGDDGRRACGAFAGLDATPFTVASNAATIFSGLPSLYNHELRGVTANTVIADLRKRLSVIKDANVLTIPPAPVQGLGSAGGFKMMLEDRAGLGSEALFKAARALVAAANEDATFASVFTLFNAGSPSVYADIDRLKAEKVGLTPTDVFSTLQVYLGSQYVNDFNYLGRTYQVRVQSDGKFRRTPQDITRLKARNTSGEMVPIGTVTQLKSKTIPYRVPRYNLFPAAEVQGVAAPGVATGTALRRMEELARQVLPKGIAFEWTDLAFQEQQHGTPTLLVFGAAALFVFLVLVAQYESWKLPLAIVLIVPMCLLASVTGLLARGMPIDILAQIG